MDENGAVSEGYDTHSDYMDWARERAAARSREIEQALRDSLRDFIEPAELSVLSFRMTDRQLATALVQAPKILKPLLAACNLASRAIERDLGIKNVNTYAPRLNEAQSLAIAAYIKEFVPDQISIAALVELDRHFFVDKTIRQNKGRWEKSILAALRDVTGCDFKKRMFESGGDKFELDGAYPIEGPIEYGIDVKRIEARRDIHKRSDEVVNKATKFKRTYPTGKFGAVVYYPFAEEHGKVRKRMRSRHVDGVAFASPDVEDIRRAIEELTAKLGFPQDHARPGLS